MRGVRGRHRSSKPGAVDIVQRQGPAGTNEKGDDEGRFAVKLSLIFRLRSINTRAADYLY